MGIWRCGGHGVVGMGGGVVAEWMCTDPHSKHRLPPCASSRPGHAWLRQSLDN